MDKTLDLPDLPIAASGSMGPLGMGWTPLHRAYYLLLPGMLPILKTVGYDAKQGNSFLRAWRPLLRERGCVNAMALGNEGIGMLLYRDLPRLKRDCIVSLHASSPEEMAKIVAAMMSVFSHHPEYFVHVLAIEINLSCPNVDAPVDLLGILKEASNLPFPIIAKIGAEQRQIDAVVEAAHLGYIQGVSAINTVPWQIVFGDRPSPIKNRTGQQGGVSGRPIKSFALTTVAELRARLPKDFPIYAGGGIQSYRDIIDFVEAGATGLVLGTVLTWHLFRAIVLLWTIHQKGLPKKN